MKSNEMEERLEQEYKTELRSADYTGDLSRVQERRRVEPALSDGWQAALYAQKVQGNVTLRIFIDREGAIVADSTRIAETSGFTALDSAAMKGSRDLKFEPAKTQGQPVPVSILLPVFFRHPDAPPLAGDSIIPRDTLTTSGNATGTDTGKADTASASASKPAAKAATRKATTKRKTTR